MINVRLPIASGQREPRDDEDSCASFHPGSPRGDCEGDGHYMCKRCAERVRAVQPWRSR